MPLTVLQLNIWFILNILKTVGVRIKNANASLFGEVK
jgi:hypothetical protein